MNVEQHIKVAQWHLEQARLHAISDHSCGCPANPHDQKAIDAWDKAMNSIDDDKKIQSEA